ncbi:MAG TPA: hypothetical protein VF884_14480 [Nitrososphaeraceae archaeon]
MKSETKYKVEKKSEAKSDLEHAGDKVKAGTKAFGNKMKEAGRELDMEYKKEKFKEDID